MSHRLNKKHVKRIISTLLAAVLIVSCLLIAGCSKAKPEAEPETVSDAAKEVKVLIIPKFEIGEKTDDIPGEAQYYFTEYLKDGEVFTVEGLKEDQKLYYKDGVAMVIAGYGKVNAAASLCAVLLDDRFDFSNCYILDVGCSGGAYGFSVMGDVNLITAVCDYDLGHRASPEEMENKDSETTWFYDPEYVESGCYKLNPELMDKVYELTKDVTLETTTEKYMARIFDQAEWATRKPKVVKATSVTSDSYWKGMTGHNDALLVTSIYDCPDPYGSTEMEDAGVAGVATRFGMLDRLIIIRDVVNMDVFMDGATPESLWDLEAAEETFLPENSTEVEELFAVSMHNNYKVGKPIIDAILTGGIK